MLACLDEVVRAGSIRRAAERRGLVRLATIDGLAPSLPPLVG